MVLDGLLQVLVTLGVLVGVVCLLDLNRWVCIVFGLIA